MKTKTKAHKRGGKGRIINAIVTCVLGAAALAVALAMFLYIRSFEHEHVGKHFSNGTRFSQITLFLPASAEFTVDKIMYFRYNLDNKLTEKAITRENPNARLYADAYTAYRDETLQSSGKRTANAKVAYVGGDYRLFHTKFAASPDVTADVNHDRILLSRSAAWQLYGGDQLYDYTAESGGKTRFISGVYADFEDKASAEFYGERSAAMADIGSETELPVTCYEILLIDPVTNFAVNTVKECLDLTEGSYVMVENSTRFSIPNLFKNIPKLVNADEPLPTGVDLTPEEIAVRQGEKLLAMMLVIFLVLAVYPFIWLLILGYRLIQLIKRFFNWLIIARIKDKLAYS